jgi:hypothetical protein
MTKSNFQIIPGVGISLASDIEKLGYIEVSDLKSQNPDEMYERLMQIDGSHIDRCVLYVFRCAVYYADGGRDVDKLKWWNWKDKK